MVINLNKCHNIINYLKIYPLKTKKFIDFKNWLKIYKMVKNKEGLINIKVLKNFLNR